MSRDTRELERAEREYESLRRQVSSVQVVREPTVAIGVTPPAEVTPTDCDDCIDGGAVFTCPKCAIAPVEYIFSPGAVACEPDAGGMQVLSASGVCQWTADWGGGDWTLDTAGAVNTLTLNGGPLFGGEPIRYVKLDEWCCLCTNVMELDCKFDACAALEPFVCVSPIAIDPVGCPKCGDVIPSAYNVTLDNIANALLCENLNAVYTVPFASQSSGRCVYELVTMVRTHFGTVDPFTAFKIRLTLQLEFIELLLLLDRPGFGKSVFERAVGYVYRMKTADFDCFAINNIGGRLVVTVDVGSFGESPDWGCTLPPETIPIEAA